MARPRKPGRTDWPTGLYKRRRGKLVYYFYKTEAREIPLGKDLNAAVAAVRLVQRRTAPDPVEQLIQRINAPKATVHQILDLWYDWWQQEEKPSKGTLDNQRWRIGKIKRLYPDKDIAAVERFELAEFLDSKVPRGEYGRYRDLFSRAFAWARSKGYRDDNPAEHTLEKKPLARQRSRLPAEQYAAIYAEAPKHLQLAMELIRLSLQRPGDLCRLTLSDWTGGVLRIEQEKTGTRLAIRPHAALAKAIEDGVAYRVADCQALLNYQPDARARGDWRVGENRSHWAQCTDQMLSRTFTTLLRRLYPDAVNPPTLYECKSLGVSQYEEAGWDKRKIQALAGHKRATTTGMYAEGHKHYEPVNLADA